MTITQINIRGSEVCILFKSIAWIIGSPFTMTDKTQFDLSIEEMRGFFNRLAADWTIVRDEVGASVALEKVFEFLLTPRQMSFVIACLEAILAECEGDPVEMRLRVGETNEVENLISHLHTLADS